MRVADVGDGIEIKGGTFCLKVSAEPDRVVVRSRGRYVDTPVHWEITYDVDVDEFTKLTVHTYTDEPLLLR